MLDSYKSIATTCNKNGVWTRSVPNCIKINCGFREKHIEQAILKRYAVCSNLSFYKSNCSLSCDSGYEIVGNTFTECLDTGRWSQTIGTCEKIQCNKIIQLLNGEVSCNNKNLYNSQCTFSCNDGYRLVGNKLAVCKANKLFSSTPSCEEVFCPHLGIKNGTLDCTKSNSYG